MLFNEQPRIRLYVDPNKIDAHWETYPFKCHFPHGRWDLPSFHKLLLERGIEITKNSKDADCIFSTIRGRIITPSKTIPTIIMEGRDSLTPLNTTRKLLNENPKVILWKWGICTNYEYALKTEFLPAGVYTNFLTYRKGIEFNPEQVKIAFNLFWHPYHSEYHFARKRKPIDIAFIGTIECKACNAFKKHHRSLCVEAIHKLPNSLSKVIIRGGLSHEDYGSILSSTKICVSPWGNSEICGRDSQGFTHDCEVVRPETKSFAETWPDVWDEAIDCAYDYSDLSEIIEKTLDTWDQDAVSKRGDKWRKMYDDKSILADRIVTLVEESVYAS